MQQKGIWSEARFVVSAKQVWSCPLNYAKTFLYKFFERLLNTKCFSHLVFKLVTFLEYIKKCYSDDLNDLQ